MQQMRWVALVALSASLVGCISKFDTTRPISRRESLLGTTYDQDGHAFDTQDFADKIDAGEQAKADARFAVRMGLVGGVVAGTAGGLLGVTGSGWLNGQEPNWILASAGAALLVASLPIFYAGDRAFSRAVDAHNRSLERPATQATPNPVMPYLLATPAGDGTRGQVAAGLTGSF